MCNKKLTQEQLKYCDSICKIGIMKREELLRQCESAFDAAFDMRSFVEDCSTSCSIMQNWYS